MPPPIGPPGRIPGDEDANPEISKELIFRIFSYLKPYKTKLIAVFTVILISSILAVLPSVLTGRIIDEGILGGDINLIVRLVIYASILIVVSNMLGLLEAYLNSSIAQGVTYDMKNQLYRHLQKMSYGFFMNRKQGEIITRMTEDINGVQTCISNTFTKAFKNIGTIVITAITLFQTNWILALIGLISVPIFMIPTKLAGQRRWKIAREIHANYDENNQVLNETLGISGQLLVKLFNRDDTEYERFEKINRKVYKLSIKEMLTGKLFFIAINIYSNFIPLVIYLIGGIMVIKQPFGPGITIGEITIVVNLLTKIHRPLDELLNLNVDITRSLALFERIFEYLDIKPDIVDKDDCVDAGRLTGQIEYEHVNFSYNKEIPVLNDINFKIQPGNTFAVVGSSGAGKSTLITLLPRLYDVTDGSIRIDGRDIRDYSMASLRENIGMVSQDTYLFNASIYENLQYANPDATMEDIIEACKKAHIHDFIDSLPSKYDTLVGNRGLRLSGGEKQRISIARVILKNPPILILDEATSSLDSISENYIQKALEPLLKDRTSLVVAHRLSTIISADEIAVIENGQIAATGHHTDLIEESKLYRKFFETQFKIPTTGGNNYD